ncbi:MAG: hypothetical protein KBC73_22045 [Burkholderiaceae bacterium]|nr:hypothetical protein [Burkholderiaceae bacterium]
MLAWALLLSGWLGGGALALVLAPGVAQAQAVIAAWPLVLAAAAWGLQVLGRRGPALQRPLLLAAGAVAALALQAAPRGGGPTALLMGLAAWAWLAAAAMQRAPAGPDRPVGLHAVLGAALAGWVLGDVNHSQALGERLAALALVAAGLLALRPVARVQAVAGRFDCLLGSAIDGVPAMLARLSMLAMMCALPLMLQQCRTGGGSATGLLAGHLAAMFVPALLSGLAGRWLRPVLVPLLLASALWPLLVRPADPVSAMLWVGLAHGLAWSLAGAAPASGSAGWTAARQSLLALLIGGLLAGWGPAALLPLQGLIGAAALLAWLGLRPPARAWRRCSAGGRRGADAPGSGARWV